MAPSCKISFTLFVIWTHGCCYNHQLTTRSNIQKNSKTRRCYFPRLNGIHGGDISPTKRRFLRRIINAVGIGSCFAPHYVIWRKWKWLCSRIGPHSDDSQCICLMSSRLSTNCFKMPFCNCGISDVDWSWKFVNNLTPLHLIIFWRKKKAPSMSAYSFKLFRVISPRRLHEMGGRLLSAMMICLEHNPSRKWTCHQSSPRIYWLLWIPFQTIK